jgi:hypothetical protein
MSTVGRTKNTAANRHPHCAHRDSHRPSRAASNGKRRSAGIDVENFVQLAEIIEFDPVRVLR